MSEAVDLHWYPTEINRSISKSTQMTSKVLFYESTVKSIPTYEISDPPTQLRRRIGVNKFSNENQSGRFWGTSNGFQKLFCQYLKSP